MDRGETADRLNPALATESPTLPGARPWPNALAGTPAATVIDRAISRQRLGHSLLLHGDDLDILVTVAQTIADRLLNPPDTPPSARRDVASGAHPDFFTLRPAGKQRQISADATRELISRVQVSAACEGGCKVAVIHEADRMNPTAANIFLKTLEEPPAHTTLLLVSTHPYALLPTIRSRCLHFKFAHFGAREGPAGGPLHEWLSDYLAWLARLPASATDKRAAADHIFTVYGLVARFGLILENSAAEAWARQKESLPPDMDEDQRTAMEIGLASGLRSRFFAEIEEATSAFARSRLQKGDTAVRRIFAAAVKKLEHDAGLLRLNLNESAALEDFLLASLRLWSRR